MTSNYVRNTLVAAVAIFSACGDATAPGPTQTGQLVGSFGLASVNGAPLPFLIVTVNGVRTLRVDDRLHFDGKGKVRRIKTTRHEPIAGGVVTIYIDSFEQEYRVHADSVWIGNFTSLGSCEACDAGTFTSDHLTLRSFLIGNPVMSYGRFVEAE